MNIKRTKFIAAFVGLCCVGIILYLADTPKKNISILQLPGATNEFVKPSVSDSHKISASSEKIPLDINKPFIANGKSYIALTAEEVSVLRNWMDERGYLRQDDLKIYEGYSEETLLSLAKQGDLKALDTLSSIATARGQREKAIMFINLGVIHGSTAALERLTIYTAPRINDDETEDQRRPAALETLAVIQVLALRGDNYLSRSDRANFINGYKQIYNSDLLLSPEEEAFVANRANEIYDKFQAIRREKGLGDFDNSEPSGVKKFFGLNKDLIQ